MLDKDLAALYEVETRALVQAVKRNIIRFPADFMFQLSKEKDGALRSQTVILKTGRGQHSKYLSYVFTEQGVAMLSSVLRNERAMLVNIEIMRTFVRLRELPASHEELARKLVALEKKYDSQFKAVFDAIRQLMAPPKPNDELDSKDETVLPKAGRITLVSGCRSGSRKRYAGLIGLHVS